MYRTIGFLVPKGYNNLLKSSSLLVREWDRLLVSSFHSTTAVYSVKKTIRTENKSYQKKYANRNEKVSKKASQKPIESDEMEESQQEDNNPPIENACKGLVIERLSDRLLVECLQEDKKNIRFMCSQKGVLQSKGERIVPGDHVDFTIIDPQDQTGMIHHLHTRHNVLQRPYASNASRRKITLKPVASNIDQLFIVIATEPVVPLSTIDRYIVAAKQYNIPNITIIVNKIDLPESEELLEELDYYPTQLHIPLLPFSIHPNNTTNYLAQLQNLLFNKTSIFVGQSGVGKSSIINTLLPAAHIPTSELLHHEQFGAHTTTNAKLYHFVPVTSTTTTTNNTTITKEDECGYIIDSPGVRELGTWHLTQEDILEGFEEIAHFAKQCRFKNCRHTLGESAYCAVQQAVEQEVIHPNRMESYELLIRQLSQ